MGLLFDRIGQGPGSLQRHHGGGGEPAGLRFLVRIGAQGRANAIADLLGLRLLQGLGGRSRPLINIILRHAVSGTD